MRTLTRKSPARRNHAVHAYHDEHLTWRVTTIVIQPQVPCFYQITSCVMSSADAATCTADDVPQCVSTCDDMPCPEEDD